MNEDRQWRKKNSVSVIWSQCCRPQHIPRQSGKPDWTSWHGSSLAGMQLRWFEVQCLAQYSVTYKSWALRQIIQIVKSLLSPWSCGQTRSTTRIYLVETIRKGKIAGKKNHLTLKKEQNRSNLVWSLLTLKLTVCNLTFTHAPFRMTVFVGTLVDIIHYTAPSPSPNHPN